MILYLCSEFNELEHDEIRHHRNWKWTWWICHCIRASQLGFKTAIVEKESLEGVPQLGMYSY